MAPIDLFFLSCMTAYLLTLQLLNFMAPAAFLAVLLMLLAHLFGRLYKRKRPAAHSWWSQAAIIFVVNLAVLVGGLVVFGVDGKMATYAAMVIAAAVTHWVLGKGWKS